jgi:hypothetical protein
LYPLLRQAPPAHEFLRAAVSGIADRLGVTALDVAAALPIAPAAQEPLTSTPIAASVAVPLGVVEAVVSPEVRISGDLLVGSAALRSFEQRASNALSGGEAPDRDWLTVFDGAPLDGARPADLLQAVLLASK